MPLNGRIFYPDTQAPNIELPEWVSMGGEDETGGISPLMGALKRKLGSSNSPMGKADGGSMTSAGKASPMASSGGKSSL